MIHQQAMLMIVSQFHDNQQAMLLDVSLSHDISLWIFFSRITSLQSHGLAEKLSQSHGNSRSLQTYYIK